VRLALGVRIASTSSTSSTRSAGSTSSTRSGQGSEQEQEHAESEGTEVAMITPESTREQVQAWLHEYDDGRFISLKSVFARSNGAELFAFTKDDMNRFAESKIELVTMVALYNTLHPPSENNAVVVRDMIPAPKKHCWYNKGSNWIALIGGLFGGGITIGGVLLTIFLT